METKPGAYRQKPIAPGSFAANAWGLFDMHGNVSEWVWDAYGPYDASGENVDPTGVAQGSLRVYRGGGWNDFGKNLRSAYRAALAPESSSISLGFRLARNAEPQAGTVSSAGGSSNAGAGNVLIAYFTWSGNSRLIANEISRQTGFTVREIRPRQAYSSDYDTVLQQAQNDQRNQARPELAQPIDVSGYDTIIVGYPNWWASIPMPVATFLESGDFTGKTIVPVCTHGGGRLGQTVTAIAKLAPTATLGTPLAVEYSGGSSLGSDVSSWLAQNNLV